MEQAGMQAGRWLTWWHEILACRGSMTTPPPVAQRGAGQGSTSGSHGHSHHRTITGPVGVEIFMSILDSVERQPNQMVNIPPKLNRKQCTLYYIVKRSHLTLTMGTLQLLTSFSEVPHRVQVLHSIHCQRYLTTLFIILGVNWRQEGWPERNKTISIQLNVYSTILQAIRVILDS